MSEEEKFREERQRSIQKALGETEKARTSAQESARRFREVEAGRPFGPLPSQAPEARRNVKVQPSQLEGFQKPTPLPKPQRFQPSRQPSKSRPRGRSRRGSFGISFRPRRAGGRPPNLPGSPANIDPEEKKRAIERLDRALAKENRKYTEQVVNGGSDVRKQQTRQKIQQLENEKRAIINMKPTGRFRYSVFGGLQRLGPLPGHVREAEKN